MTSIGTLFAFVVVCAAVLILRSRRPDARRPFRVPFGPVIPILGVISCVYLMVNLTVMTWMRFLVWLDLGMIIYWFYGRTHSPLVDPAESRARTSGEAFANFLKISGYMLLFNGFCITLLGLLTEWGVTKEELAKWHELDAVLSRIGMHINPEIADAFGLRILIIGAVVAVLGIVMARSSAKR
jgi:amino acid transporter